MSCASVLLLSVAGLFIFATLGQLDTDTFVEVQGKVLATRLDVSSRSGSVHSRTSYTPMIEYEFSVDGQSYKSNRYTLGTRLVNQTETEATHKLEQYPAGKLITIYYDPEDPARSTLVRGTGQGEAIVWSLAAVMIAIVIIGWVLTIRRFHAFKNQPYENRAY